MEVIRRTVRSPTHVAALRLLILIFCLRVVGQLTQVLAPVPWLPPLAMWQGSTIPYSLLLSLQLVILVAMLLVAARHATGDIHRRARVGRWLLLAGSVYFLVMAARLTIGLAGWSEGPWFQRPIPAFFHLVLAAYLLVLAAFHLNWPDRE